MAEAAQAFSKRGWQLGRHSWRWIEGGVRIATPLGNLGRQLEPFLESVRKERESLTPIAREIEVKFMQVADALEGVPSTSQALVGQAERLLALASGKEEGGSM